MSKLPPHPLPQVQKLPLQGFTQQILPRDPHALYVRRRRGRGTIAITGLNYSRAPWVPRIATGDQHRGPTRPVAWPPPARASTASSAFWSLGDTITCLKQKGRVFVASQPSPALSVAAGFSSRGVAVHCHPRAETTGVFLEGTW